MPSFSSAVLLAFFGIVCGLEIIKAQVLGAATAANRGKLKLFVNPEDAHWLGGRAVENDHERVQRIFRAHRNELENLIPFFVGGTLYLSAGADALAGAAYFALFLVARTAHTFAYLTRRARLRRNAFTLGWLVTIALAIHGALSLALQALR